MKIPDLYSNIRLNIESLNNRTLQNLRSGQLLQALVVSQTDQGVAKIRLGSLEVAAKTDIKLSPGEKLVLEVIKTGTLPEMRVVRAPDLEMLKSQALRTILPNQLPIAKLIENLRSHIPILSSVYNPQTAVEKNLKSDSPGIRGRSVPDLIPLLRSISIQSVGMDEPVTAELIRRLLNESGLFLESRLASGLTPLPNDLKVNLLRLLHLLRPKLASLPPGINSQQEGNQVLRLGKSDLLSDSSLKPLIDLLAQSGSAISRTQLKQLISLSVDDVIDQVWKSSKNELPGGSLLKSLIELLTQSESAISRVRMNQLNSLPANDESRQLWQFEIPINQKNHTDSFLVRIEHNGSGNRMQHDHSWSVTINFDLQPLGAVSARINLQQGEISGHFTAEKKVSAVRLQRELPKLHQALLKAGLKVGNLSARLGSIENSGIGIPTDHPLLDEKA